MWIDGRTNTWDVFDWRKKKTSYRKCRNSRIPFEDDDNDNK